MHIAELSPEVYSRHPHARDGVEARSVGWLGNTVPRRGRVPPEVLEQLRHYRRAASHDDAELGWHRCEICNGQHDYRDGSGEFWIEWNGVRYVLPSLVIHYCEAHGYVPPDELLTALAARWAADQMASPVEDLDLDEL